MFGTKNRADAVVDRAAAHANVLEGFPRGQQDRKPEQFETPNAFFADPEQVAERLAFRRGDFLY